MDFQLTEEQTLIQDMAKNFAASELAPHSSKWDEEKFLDRSVFTKAAELGFMGMYSTEEHGGTALSRLDSAIVFEQLAAGDVSHTAMMTIHNMATWMVDRYADDNLMEQRHLSQAQDGRTFMSLWRAHQIMAQRVCLLL